MLEIDENDLVVRVCTLKYLPITNHERNGFTLQFNVRLVSTDSIGKTPNGSGGQAGGITQLCG
jgi:hypothetical protein